MILVYRLRLILEVIVVNCIVYGWFFFEGRFEQFLFIEEEGVDLKIQERDEVGGGEDRDEVKMMDLRDI